MKLLGFNFTKINAERLPKKEETKGIKINTNIDISEIVEAKSEILKKETVLAIRFTYNIDYSPDYAKISLEGNLLLGVDSKTARNALNEWKDKKISENIRLLVFNAIFKKANLKALQLEEELNLPLHIPMPTLNVSDKKEQEQ